MQGLLSVCERMDLRGVDSSALRSLSPSLFLRGGGFVHGRISMRRAAERERLIIANCRNVIGRTRFDEDVIHAINPSCRYFPSNHEILRPEFYSAAWSVGIAEPATVYCTGGSYVRKGISTLLEAVALLKRRAVPGIHVRIAGSLGSPEEEERAAKHRIRKLGLGDSVVLLGIIPPSEIVAELLRARVFALSSHVDNSPNALAEAMMIGVPCVASSVGGVPSMARDGVEALLVQDGDPFALAGALAFSGVATASRERTYRLAIMPKNKNTRST